MTSTSKHLKISNTTTYLGLNQQFIVTAQYSDNSIQNVTALGIWSSSNSNIAFVSNAAGYQGFLTPIAVGSTVITISFGGISASTNLTVSGAVLQSLTITPTSITIPVGFNQQYKAVGAYSDGSTQNVTSAVIWSSSNLTFAAMNNAAGYQGLATGVAVGTTSIKASMNGITSNTTSLTRLLSELKHIK